MSDMNLHINKGTLTNFADDTQLTTIEESEEIAALHASTSTNADNQTLAPDAEKPLDDHFICLVHREGEIFEVNDTYLTIICIQKSTFFG